ESDLHAELAPVLGSEPAGDVPPLVAELRMAAAVARKLQRHAWPHRGVIARGERGRRQQAERDERGGAQPHHSSSTALTAAPPIAWRPLAIAVSVASASMTATNSARSRHGRCSSMPQ